jgi:hypothetical protein
VLHGEQRGRAHIGLARAWLPNEDRVRRDRLTAGQREGDLSSNGMALAHTEIALARGCEEERHHGALPIDERKRSAREHNSRVARRPTPTPIAVLPYGYLHRELDGARAARSAAFQGHLRGMP